MNFVYIQSFIEWWMRIINLYILTAYKVTICIFIFNLNISLYDNLGQTRLNDIFNLYIIKTYNTKFYDMTFIMWYKILMFFFFFYNILHTIYNFISLNLFVYMIINYIHLMIISLFFFSYYYIIRAEYIITISLYVFWNIIINVIYIIYIWWWWGDIDYI